MVSIFDLKRQYCSIENEINSAINSVFSSGNFILGDSVKKFEQEISDYLEVKNAIGVASGSDALLISLLALDIKGEVITTPFTFFATAGSIYRAGCKPVFVDIGKDYNLNPDKIKEKITPSTRAIMPVHLFGKPCNMNKIVDIAKKYNLRIIEDACQAIGSEFNGKKIGSFDIGGFSFFPTKNLGCYGDGGLITTNDNEVAEKARILRVHGSKPKYYHSIIGLNSRLDALQAAILSVKLPYLDKWNKGRKQNAEYYSYLLSDLQESEEIKLPSSEGVFTLYTIRAKKRNDLKKHLENKEIGSGIYYPLPLHLQECFSNLGYQKGDFPETEKTCEEVFSLPCYPELKKQEIEYICDSIKNFYKK